MPEHPLSEGSLHYTDHPGAEPPFVLVHGFACAGEDWQPQVTALAGDHRVLTVDLPGHGHSPAPPGGVDIEVCARAVVSLLEGLDLSGAVLVGHSMGCRVVLETARLSPARVAAVALVDGSRFAEGDPEEAARTMRARVEAAGFARLRDTLFGGMFTGERVPAEREAILARAAAVPVSVAEPLFVSMAVWDAGRLEGVLDAVAVPLLVVQSTYMDASGTRASIPDGLDLPWFEVLRRHVPDVRIERLTGTGHFSMLEAPAVLERWLRELAAQAVAA
jgi:pimeloyl-ACP methyl ester carboxylesterase